MEGAAHQFLLVSDACLHSLRVESAREQPAGVLLRESGRFLLPTLPQL